MLGLRRSILPVLLLASLTAALAPAVAPAHGTPEVRTPCDALDEAQCLLPFPNNRFTTADDGTDTGRRVDLQVAEMPRNRAGKPIDPTEWNRQDGFSPGSMLLTFVPRLDLHKTWNDPVDHIADLARYAEPDAPMLVIDAATGERHPFWSELDTNAETKDHERLLILRPAVNFAEGRTYYVALRNMRESSGAIIPAGPHFAAYRDNTAGPAGFEETRRADMNRIITGVAHAETARGNSFDRGELFLAWEFTVASRRNLTERALHIRDTAFAQLGDTNLANGTIEGAAPSFTITEVLDRSNEAAKLREIRGTVSVPNFLDRPPLPPVERLPAPAPNPAPGQAIPMGRFLYGLDGLPMQNPAIPTIDAPFVCTLPKSTAVSPAHPMLYGHGLLGSRFESAGSSSLRMRERNFMPCSVNWMGMAEYDVANALLTLSDPSNMASMMDRAQQGYLNFMLLGRAMAHPGGFAAHPAFRDASGAPLIETNKLVYDGNSQGGIMGGALAALAPDFTRATLGVPGMNYSTLLNRSVDWEGPLVDPANPTALPSYASFLYTQFPDKQQQQIVMHLLQMLWDRGEANGYAHHMSDDPLPNTPPHQIMLHVAFGDFQVTNVSAEVEARTIGARVIDTALGAGRHWSSDPSWGMTAFDRGTGGELLPWNGSALVYWDSGNLVPPNGNVPPLLEGGDPHEDPRRDHRSGDQRARFFRTGEIVDVFAGGPYLTCRPDRAHEIPRVRRLFPNDWCV